MSWGMVAVAGASLVGGTMAARSAGKASDTQASAAREANELQREQFEQIRSDLAPYRTIGSDATNVLARYLGVAPQAGSAQDIQRQVDALEVPDTYMSGQTNDPLWERILGEFNASHSARFGSGMNRAWGADADAQRQYEVLANQYRDAKRAEMQAQAAAQPAQAPGGGADFGSLLRNFTGDDLENEPGYQFGLAEGNKALDRRFASGGNYFSGAALKGATRYAQDYAGTKYGEAFNRDAANKGRIYNFLSGTMGAGQNAAAQTGSAGQAMAANVGQTTTGAANASGAAQIAQGNALSGGVNNIAGMYQQNQLMDKITQGNRGWESWRTSGNGMPY